MSYRLDVQLEAIVDIKRAYEWYEDRRIGLGVELITEIEDCYALISEYPDRYGFINASASFRRIRVHRFPYLIVYEIAGDAVIVSMVKHIKQDRTYI